jgi:hypothetical protein
MPVPKSLIALYKRCTFVSIKFFETTLTCM